MREKANTIVRSPWISMAASVLSGVLLAMGFPGFDMPTSVYVALVPLMFAVRSASIRKAALLGLLSGFVFFMLSLSWLRNLTGGVDTLMLKASALLGYSVLALYCALYFIPPALSVAACVRRWGTESWRGNLRTMFAVSMVWVAAEYLRGLLFTGFPWNPLGVSQYGSPALIQISAWGGVYIVSACIVWMNTALFVTLDQYLRGLRARKYRAHVELMFGLLPTALCFAYGVQTLGNRPPFPNPVRIALIQPNVAQSEKWDSTRDEQTRETLEELTLTIARSGDIDLMIWPETAVPDTVHTEYSSRGLIRRMAGEGVPLLVGAIAYRDGVYYNSSLLYDTNANLVAQYDKQHLVPFGEYVPFPKLMGKFTPVEVDVGHGKESTLFPLPGQASFSTLICFEDTVAPLAGKAVRNGARWLINQTNDAWFDPSAQSEQHLAHAVFRCVENRIAMARCCNTGVTCTIDAYGSIQRQIDPLTEGATTAGIRPRPLGLAKTFYTRYGDIFAWFALLTTGTVFFALRFKGRPGPETE